MLNTLSAAHYRDAHRAQLAGRYRKVREATRRLVKPLSAEDCQLQSMPDASPTKWHLAHTSWFFETFVLAGARPFDPSFAVLFNSYYQTVGEQHPRPQRGLLSRPSLETVWRYRDSVDERMAALVERETLAPSTMAVIELGLNHEQQHQELILTDIKHAFAQNPELPAISVKASSRQRTTTPILEWIPYEGGACAIGHDGKGFSFDNELPRHRVWLEPFVLSNRLATVSDYLAFMDAGGYRRPDLWLSEGWDWLARERIDAPLYWYLRDGSWHVYTLGGLRRLDPHEPVTHVSLYEADAFARWANARLPREAELEVALREHDVAGNFVESGLLHPVAADGSQQLYGDTWEWTQSSYAAYPGYQPAKGALGEYNGKFMCNQYVLRGGSCFSPGDHLRPTYRNFFPAHTRWQMSGIRLARDV